MKMIQKLRKTILNTTIIILLVLSGSITIFAQSNRLKEATRIYDSLKSHNIAFPKTVLAIVIYETGWMQCKSCALKYNNLFGFRTNKDFLKFSSVSESIKYMKKWQNRYYLPWKARHPEGTYHEYLVYIGYCDNMDSYLKNIKNIEEWLSNNIAMVKE